MGYVVFVEDRVAGSCLWSAVCFPVPLRYLVGAHTVTPASATWCLLSCPLMCHTRRYSWCQWLSTCVHRDPRGECGHGEPASQFSPRLVSGWGPLACLDGWWILFLKRVELENIGVHRYFKKVVFWGRWSRKLMGKTFFFPFWMCCLLAWGTECILCHSPSDLYFPFLDKIHIT